MATPSLVVAAAGIRLPKHPTSAEEVAEATSAVAEAATSVAAVTPAEATPVAAGTPAAMVAAVTTTKPRSHSTERRMTTLGWSFCIPLQS